MTLIAEGGGTVLNRSGHPAPSVSKILTARFPMLNRYLEEPRFDAIAAECEKTANTKLASETAILNGLSEVLRGRHFAKEPELAELVAFEIAMHEARSTLPHNFVSLTNLASLHWPRLGEARLLISPSARRFKVLTNVTSIVACLSCDEAPPPPRMLGFCQQMLVWRQGSSARFRILGDEEAMALDAAIAGKDLAQIRDMIGSLECPETAEARTMIYLRGWAEAQLIEKITPSARSAGSNPGRAA